MKKLTNNTAVAENTTVTENTAAVTQEKAPKSTKKSEKKSEKKTAEKAPEATAEKAPEKKPEKPAEKELVMRANKSFAIVATTDEKTDERIRGAERPQTAKLFTETKRQYRKLMSELKLDAEIPADWNVRDLVAEADARIAKADAKAVRRLKYFVKAYDNRTVGCYCFANHGSASYDNADQFKPAVTVA